MKPETTGAREGDGSRPVVVVPAMTAAHRLYLRNGFVRVPQRDWVPEPDLTLIAFRLELAPR